MRDAGYLLPSLFRRGAGGEVTNTMYRMLRISVAITLLAFLAVSFASAASGLDLSADQKARMKDLMQSTRQQTQTLRQTLEDRRHQLMRVYGEYSLKTDKARSINRDINDFQLRLLNANLDSQSGIRGILRREQFGQFNELVRHPRGRHGPGEMLEDGKGMPFGPGEIKPLGMSQPQQGNMKRLWRKSQERPTAAIETIKAKSTELETLYHNYDLDGQKARTVIRDLNGAQKQLLDARLRLQVELRQSLTEEQFNRLRDAMEQRMRNWRMRHGGPRPGFGR
jgi:Spy/CpxP family protein refolding chaperone